jgi:hypothetical protein
MHIISHFIFFEGVEGIMCLEGIQYLVVEGIEGIQCLEGIECLVVDRGYFIMFCYRKLYKRCCLYQQQSVVTVLKKGEHLIS